MTASGGSLDPVACRLDGEWIPVAGATIATMNFDQERLGGSHVLEVELALATAIEIMQEGWQELLEDAYSYPDLQGDHPVEFAVSSAIQHGRSLSAVLDDPEPGPAVLEFFGHELLLRTLGDGVPDQPPYAIGTRMMAVRRFGDIIAITAAAVISGAGTAAPQSFA
ncbi:hypothetical protein AB0I72_07860 [Nocardiopsis sp. NPDC049922]|uniref:hypothetical protein n=1 Tax=Nocardiopsis sp. NPDC049922 TaxID=3155157 RepID=UPI0033DE776C